MWRAGYREPVQVTVMTAPCGQVTNWSGISFGGLSPLALLAFRSG